MHKVKLGNVLLILAMSACCTQYCLGQGKVKSDGPLVTLVSNLSQGQTAVKTSSILLSPRLKYSKPVNQVVSFDVSILYQNLPGSEKNEYFGPYKGASADLPAEIVNLLKKYPERNGRIFIENIVAKMEDGVNRNLNPIILSFSK